MFSDNNDVTNQDENQKYYELNSTLNTMFNRIGEQLNQFSSGKTIIDNLRESERLNISKDAKALLFENLSKDQTDQFDELFFKEHAEIDYSHKKSF